MINLTGKRALITGGSRGIGAAITKTLASMGADVAFTYQQASGKAQDIVRAVEQSGRRGVAIRADSASPADIARAVDETVSTLGGLDILVNSAAVGHTGTIADLDIDAFQTLMDINVRAPVPSPKQRSRTSGEAAGSSRSVPHSASACRSPVSRPRRCQRPR